MEALNFFFFWRQHVIGFPSKQRNNLHRGSIQVVIRGMMMMMMVVVVVVVVVSA